MKKALKQIASALVLAVAAALPAQAIDTNTYTNVLQNLNIALTVYEQGPNATNSEGTRVTDKVSKLTTQFILEELSLLNPGTNFTGAKLVVATSYYTNNQYLIAEYTSNVYGSGVITTNIPFNTLSNYTELTNVALDNTGYTIGGGYTNASRSFAVLGVTGPTVVIGNNSGEVGILVGKTFTPLTNYFNARTYFSTNQYDYYYDWDNQPDFVTEISDDSKNQGVPDIIVGTGKGLNTTNAQFNAGSTRLYLGDANVFMVSTNLAPTAFTNLNFDLYGMVKQTLVLDTLHGTNRADIFSATANVTAAGFIGGETLSVPDNGYTNDNNPPNTYLIGNYSTYIPNQDTNYNAQSTTLFYVTNYSPALIEGTITLTPLPNEPVGGAIPQD